MTTDIIVGLMLLVILLAAIVGAHRFERRGLLDRRIAELGDQLRLRHIYAEQARYDVRVFLELFLAVTTLAEYLRFNHSSEARQFQENLEAFGSVLEKVGARHGLQRNGAAADGFPQAREPTARELAEVAVLMGIEL